MRLHYLISFSLLGFAACADQPDDELPFEGEASDDGKADHASVALTDFDANIGSSRLQRGGTVIMTSRNAWTRLMGTTPPANVDFSKEWVVFYGSGVKNTGGYSATVTELEYSASQRSLTVATKATSPGNDCIVTQAFTTPHHVAKFTIPSPRPLYALADHADEVKRCSPSNAERLVELAESRQAWDTAKLANGNSYTYTREVGAFTGFTSRTTVVVANGTVTERHYKAQHIDGSNPVSWTETGAQVGSHDEGYEPVLVDALYDECRTSVLTQDEYQNWMNFSTDERGLLRTCTYTPMGCYDGCSHGPVISTLTF